MGGVAGIGAFAVPVAGTDPVGCIGEANGGRVSVRAEFERTSARRRKDAYRALCQTGAGRRGFHPSASGLKYRIARPVVRSAIPLNAVRTVFQVCHGPE